MRREDIHIRMESLESIAALAERTAHYEQSRTFGHSDTHGCTFGQALVLARRGWPEGAERARRILDKISAPKIEDAHSATVHDVQGSYVDVGEYVQGVPECMVDFRPDSRPARFAHIVVSASYNGSFRGEQAMNRGVAIAAVVDALEARGIRCDVDVIDGTGSRGFPTRNEYIHLTVKRAAEPLNLDTLVFAVAHPAYLRRLMFAVMEMQDASFRATFGVGNGYGHAIPVPVTGGAIVFDTPHYLEDWSEAGALKKINEVLAKFDAEHREAKS